MFLRKNNLMPINLFIIDRLEISRAGIRSAVDETSDLTVTGEFSDLDSARTALKASAPDILLIDFASETEHSPNQVVELVSEYPDLKVLVYSAQDSRDEAWGVLRGGACGFISKNARLAEVIVAIRSVYDGRIFVCHSPQSPLNAGNGPHLPNALGNPVPTVAGLSQRECQVLGLVAEGFTNKQIAQQLFLSVKTVETYRSRVMRKAGLADRAAAIRFARQAGLCNTAG